MSQSRISHAESLLRLKLSGSFVRPPRRESPRQTSPRKRKVKKKKKKEKKRSVQTVASTTNTAASPPPTTPTTRIPFLATAQLPLTTPVLTSCAPATTLKTTPTPLQTNIKTCISFNGGNITVPQPLGLLNHFTIEAIVCPSAGNIKLRKHNGLDVDERGRFLNWSCCGGKDPDPFSFCGKWTGHGLKRIPGTICQHASFMLTTTYFSVIHPNGSTTTLDDFYLPVDRFVYVTASFDGSYLRIYMNGELLSAKCTENILDQKKNQSPKKKVNQNKSGVVAVGEGFIGMVSYVRLWDKTLTSRELLASMHPYFSNAQNNGTKSTLNVIDVLVPQNRGTNPNLVLDLPICDATSFTRVPFVAISSSGKATKGGAALQGQFSFIVRPPLYVGAKRTVARMAPRNKFGWPSFHKLCGELRNNGMITITIFRNATNSTGLNAANQILKSIAVQLFAQDWAVRQIHSEQEEKEEHLTITFTYFDVDGVEHVSDLYFEDNDEESILESVEAVVRSATTKTDRMVHQHLRNTFRSSLWSLEFGSGHAEMTFKQIFRSLEKVTTGKSLEELMVSQHVMLPKKQTKASTRLTQVQFTEGLWVAGMIAHMPEIIECARQLGNRMVQYRAVEVEPNSFSSPESSNTVEDSSGRTLDLDNGVLSTRSQLELNTMVDLAPDRLISYSVTAEWNTHTITNPQAALETSATMDVLCVALDERNIPLETINVTNVDSEDNAVRCGANDHQKNHHSPIQLFKEFENTTTHSVTRSLTFEFDLNLTMSNVKTFALVLGSNGSEQNNVFDAVGDVVVSVHRITHDEQSYQQMAFEQRRKSGGTKSAMEGTSNLNAKVYKTDSMGMYRQDCHGPHSAMVLCVFERVQHTKWGFRLSYAKLQNTVCPFEHVMRTAQLLRLLLSNRKQRVTILYCDGCEHHQKTSWHMPGQFKNMFECIRVLLKRLMPSLLVFGQPVTNAVGSFEVYFTPFEGGAVQLLYSALRQRGWLPTPELIAEKVQRAIKDLHWNRPATAGTLTLNSMVKEYENKHDTNDKNTSDTNVLRFVVRDAVTEQTLRSVPIYIFCVDTFDDITYAHKCIKTIRATKAAGLPPPTLKSSEYCVTTAYTNGRGRGEVPLQVGRTYAVHVELQGYYPIEIVALKWSQVSTTTKTTTSKHHHGSGGRGGRDGRGGSGGRGGRGGRSGSGGCGGSGNSSNGAGNNDAGSNVNNMGSSNTNYAQEKGTSVVPGTNKDSLTKTQYKKQHGTTIVQQLSVVFISLLIFWWQASNIENGVPMPRAAREACAVLGLKQHWKLFTNLSSSITGNFDCRPVLIGVIKNPTERQEEEADDKEDVTLRLNHHVNLLRWKQDGFLNNPTLYQSVEQVLKDESPKNQGREKKRSFFKQMVNILTTTSNWARWTAAVRSNEFAMMTTGDYFCRLWNRQRKTNVTVTMDGEQVDIIYGSTPTAVVNAAEIFCKHYNLANEQCQSLYDTMVEKSKAERLHHYYFLSVCEFGKVHGIRQNCYENENRLSFQKDTRDLPVALNVVFQELV